MRYGRDAAKRLLCAALCLCLLLGGCSPKDMEPSPAPMESSGVSFQEAAPQGRYVLNLRTKKFHQPGCPSVKAMSAQNKRFSAAERSSLLAEGYVPCGRCRP